MKKKIVIVNVHWNNRGDEAALRGLWLNLRKKFPTYEITTIFKDRNPIDEKLSFFTDKILVNSFKETFFTIIICILFKGKIFQKKNLSKLIKTLLDAEFIIYGPGGSVISDTFYKYKQLEYLTPFIVAFLYNIPFYVLGPSFGPFDILKKFKIRKFFLGTVKKLCVREEFSKNYLLEINNKCKVLTTTDLSLSYEFSDLKTNRKIKLELNKFNFYDNKNKIVGLTLTDFSWHVKIGKDKRLIEKLNLIYQEFINYLIENDFKVLLIPQLFGSQNDYKYLKSFEKKNKNIEVLSPEFDCDDQKIIISNLHALVGARYHSNIFAVMMKVPNISIIYEDKMRGFLKGCELESLGLDLYDLDKDKLIKKFKKVSINRKSIIDLYNKILPTLRKKSKSSFEILNEIR